MSTPSDNNSLTFTEVRRQIIANVIGIFPRMSLRHARDHCEVVVSLVNSSSQDGTKDRYKATLVYQFRPISWIVAESSPQTTMLAAAEALLSVTADEISVKERKGSKPGDRAQRACRRVGGVIWREPLAQIRPANPVAADSETDSYHGSILRSSLGEEEAVRQCSPTFTNPCSAPPVPGARPSVTSGDASPLNQTNDLVPSTAATRSLATHQSMRRVSRAVRQVSGFAVRSKNAFKNGLFALKRDQSNE